MATGQYNLQAIRQLIEEAFHADLIDVLALDLFPSVYGKFSFGTSTTQRILAIVDFAARNGSIPKLLTYIRERNVYQYDRFAPKLGVLEANDQLTLPTFDFEDPRLVSIYEYITRGLVLLKQYEEDLQTEFNQRVENEIERQNESLSQYRQETSELSFEFSARRYGIGYDIQDIKCIVYKDGSALVQRSSTILAYTEIKSLEAYILVPEASSTGQVKEVDFIDIESLSPDRNILITYLEKGFQRLSVTLAFAPTLTTGDETRFQMTEKLPPGLYAINLNKQQISERAEPYDYFAWNINRPTRRLRLQIFFPEAFSPDIFSAVVYYASASGLPADRIQFEEQQRVQKPTQVIQAGRCILTLEVDYPMIGLIYAIRWDPRPSDN